MTPDLVARKRLLLTLEEILVWLFTGWDWRPLVPPLTVVIVILSALLFVAVRDNGPVCIDNPVGHIREWLGQ